MKDTLYYCLKGRIQGVGFRPLVSNLAKHLGLKGFIRNNGSGVEIALQGKNKDQFLEKLYENLPAIARIDSLQSFLKQEEEFLSFSILSSSLDKNHIFIAPIPDFALCQDCHKEILNPNQRRFFYPLINCTNCGPRFSVIKQFPYDRERTSMADFVLCEECLEQYQDFQSRFFHAQPISCPKCSPKISWIGVIREDFKELFKEIAQVIKNGKIVCIQGIGGFHLLCDATQKNAVKQLRELKNRPTKPLALMCKDIEQVKKIAHITPKEEEILVSKEAPIVLLKSKQSIEGIALDRYGIMLAYTPIYKLLFEFLDTPLVATSANPKGEPITYNTQEAQSLFAPYVLTHQREIFNPIEDSIVQVLSTNDLVVLRNARGYAPLGFNLDQKAPYPLLAMGANQKASFAFAFEDMLIVSPYIGDLDNLSSIARFKESLESFKRLYSLEFSEVICDLHPHYESTKIAFELVNQPVQIQHHFAHALSVCFEYKITHKVLSFCFDGTGYGSDGAIWGGEVMLVDPYGFERLLHFRYFPLLGGEVAIKEIYRNFFALLGDEIELEEKMAFFLQHNKTIQELKTLEIMRTRKINSPQTSSVGRIFDGIAWICGLESQSYEGESGEFIQSLYDASVSAYYGFKIQEDEIILDILEIFQDAQKGCNPAEIASKFLNTLVLLIVEISNQYSYEIVLCGGVFCNRILSAKVLEILRSQNRACYIGNQIPPNDNGIAIGQLYHLIKRRSDAR